MALNKTTRNAIDDSAITTEKIEDGAITAGKFAAGDLSISKTLLLNAAPTISSLDTSQINPDSGATVTITGTGFVSIPDVRFLNTSTGVRIQASTIGFTSSTTITAAFPSGQTVGTYKVLVENPDGKGVISTSTITYSAAPTWSTAANLGSIEEGETVNIQLLAYDDDSTAVSSYSLVSGSLPSGVTLSGDSSVGALTGTAPEVDADTNYTFTIRATDDESQTSDREFTLTVTNWIVANSLRFDDGSSDYLNRTLASDGNRQKWTWSGWVKRSGFVASQMLFGCKSGNISASLNFRDDQLRFLDYDDGVFGSQLKTNRLFRDVSSWYHIVVAYDTTQGTASNRIKFYVNGVQETSFATSTYPSVNFNGYINESDYTHYVGSEDGSQNFFDGYMAEVCFINDQQLDATSFGETDTASGIWKPKSVSGLTFGTNGFYLPFTNSASLGADSSGNSNDFTVNNLTAIDQTTDTPMNNFATYNPLLPVTVTFSDGNLTGATSSNWECSASTIPVTKGKWYCEINVVSITTGTVLIGVEDIDLINVWQNSFVGTSANGYGYQSNGNKYNNSTSSSYSDSYTIGDIIGIVLDMDNKYVYFSKNGVFQNSGDPTSGASGTGGLALSGTEYVFVASAFSGTLSANFGSPPYTISSGNADANGYGNFEYAVPSGYFALNTKNLAEYG
jgi:hypothetical protein